MPVRRLLATLSTLVLAAAAHSAPRAAPVQTPLERAVADFQAGRFAAVLEAGASLAADAPDRARLDYLIGEAQLVLDRPAQAEASFRAVLAARPKAVPAQVGLGRALTLQDRIDEAEVPLKSALSAEPKDLGARIAMGELQMARHDLPAAAALLAAAHADAPDDALATRAYFEVLMRLDQRLPAVELAEASIQRRPEHPLGVFLVAVVMERDGEDAAAQEQYLRALELDPGFIDAHKNLAILCHTLSKNYSDKVRARLAYEHYAAYFELGGGDEHLRALYDELLGYRDQILGA